MDGIANLIVQIKNGNDARKETVSVIHTKISEAILEVLKKEGYVGDIAKKGKKLPKLLEVGLLYDEYGPRVKGVERVSHLSKRIYGGVKKMSSVKQGHGIMVVTTPKGVMTDAEARKQKVGGEILFKIW